MATYPDSLPTIGGFPIFQVSRNPYPIILLIIIIIVIRGIRSFIVVSNWGRRGYKNKRWSDKESKMGTAMRVVSVPVPGPS